MSVLRTINLYFFYPFSRQLLEIVSRQKSSGWVFKNAKKSYTIVCHLTRKFSKEKALRLSSKCCKLFMKDENLVWLKRINYKLRSKYSLLSQVKIDIFFLFSMIINFLEPTLQGMCRKLFFSTLAYYIHCTKYSPNYAVPYSPHLHYHCVPKKHSSDRGLFYVVNVLYYFKIG